MLLLFAMSYEPRDGCCVHGDVVAMHVSYFCTHSTLSTNSSTL